MRRYAPFVHTSVFITTFHADFCLPTHAIRGRRVLFAKNKQPTGRLADAYTQIPPTTSSNIKSLNQNQPTII